MGNYLSLGLSTVAIAFLAGGAANSAPIVIYGNSGGLWSPTHSQITGLRSTPYVSRPVYTPAPVAQIPTVQPPPVVDSFAPQAPDVCFTALTRPSFC